MVCGDNDVIAGRRRHACLACCRKFVAFLFSQVGLASTVIAYSILGGFVFRELEAPFEADIRQKLTEFRRDQVREISHLIAAGFTARRRNSTLRITDDLERLLVAYQKRVAEAIKQEGWDGRDDLRPEQWSFAGALLYSVTVTTTIGYGHVTPKTGWGRFVTILYAVIGIPLTFLFLSTIGNFLAHCFRVFYRRVCCDVCCCRRCERTRRRRLLLLRPDSVPAGASTPLPLATRLVAAWDPAASSFGPLVKTSSLPEDLVTCGVVVGRDWKSAARDGSGGTARNHVIAHQVSDPVGNARVNNSVTSTNSSKSLPAFNSFMRRPRHRQQATRTLLEQSETDCTETANLGSSNGASSDNARQFVARIRRRMRGRHPGCCVQPIDVELDRVDGGTDPASLLNRKTQRTSAQSNTSTDATPRTSRDHVITVVKPTTTVRGQLTVTAAAVQRSRLHRAASERVSCTSTRPRPAAVVMRRRPAQIRPPSATADNISVKRSSATQLTDRAPVCPTAADVEDIDGRSQRAADSEVLSVGNAVVVLEEHITAYHQRPTSVAESMDSFVTAFDELSATDDTDDLLCRSASVGSIGERDDVTLRRRDASIDSRNVELRTARKYVANRLKYDTVRPTSNYAGVTSRGQLLKRRDSSKIRLTAATTVDEESGLMVSQHTATGSFVNEQQPHCTKVRVPIYVCLIVIVGYILLGSALFVLWEGWDMLTASYFCFITLSTIGFGDIVPGTALNDWSSQHEKLVLCALWLALGLSLLAMCFNLMQEEVKEKCKWAAQKCGLIKPDDQMD